MPRTGPNIVLIHCHDLGRHLGCYGRDVHTPNIDALAAESVRFDDYFAAAPQCSPSRASIMTGRYPHRNGVMGLIHRGWDLNDDEVALPAQLSDAGYKTHLFGLQHAAVHADQLGYDHIHTDTPHGCDIADDVDTHRAREVADRFEETVDRLADDEPFLATAGFAEPHGPFRRSYVPDEAIDRYDPDDIELPEPLADRDDLRKDLAAYKALITGTVDPAVGQITDAIVEAGVADDTIVVLTTDHGIPFDGGKSTGFDLGLGTDLLVDHPDAAAGTSDALLSNVDLTPTLLNMAGVDIPENVDGRSFRSLVEGGEYESRERVFAEQTWHVRLSPVRAVRTDGYKYVRNVMTHIPRAGGRPDPDAPWPNEELYDLGEDPHEQQNHATGASFYKRWAPDAADDGPDPDYEQPLADLRSHLREWMDATDDPLLDGDVPMHPWQHAQLTE
jgi:arylsulfatase A-like enzyme